MRSQPEETTATAFILIYQSALAASCSRRSTACIPAIAKSGAHGSEGVNCTSSSRISIARILHLVHVRRQQIIESSVQAFANHHHRVICNVCQASVYGVEILGRSEPAAQDEPEPRGGYGLDRSKACRSGSFVDGHRYSESLIYALSASQKHSWAHLWQSPNNKVSKSTSEQAKRLLKSILTKEVQGTQ